MFEMACRVCIGEKINKEEDEDGVERVRIYVSIYVFEYKILSARRG